MPTPNSSHIKWTITIIRGLSVIYEYNATNFSGGTSGKKQKKTKKPCLPIQET